jgi:hypothetical protein
MTSRWPESSRLSHPFANDRHDPRRGNYPKEGTRSATPAKHTYTGGAKSSARAARQISLTWTQTPSIIEESQPAESAGHCEIRQFEELPGDHFEGHFEGQNAAGGGLPEPQSTA